ncbi:MAG TPA: hypothetical protein VI386_03465 [Candidatus Sulfotelmatobacter sp.]
MYTPSLGHFDRALEEEEKAVNDQPNGAFVERKERFKMKPPGIAQDTSSTIALNTATPEIKRFPITGIHRDKEKQLPMSSVSPEISTDSFYRLFPVTSEI